MLLIEAMASCDKVCNYIHLPLQSGSTKVLKEMRRTYTAEAYQELVAQNAGAYPESLNLHGRDCWLLWRNRRPNSWKRTTMMAEIRYDSAFMFKYSSREGTLAYKTLDDDVSEEEKGRRLKEIIALQEGISHEINQNWLVKP